MKTERMMKMASLSARDLLKITVVGLNRLTYSESVPFCYAGELIKRYEDDADAPVWLQIMANAGDIHLAIEEAEREFFLWLAEKMGLSEVEDVRNI